MIIDKDWFVTHAGATFLFLSNLMLSVFCYATIYRVKAKKINISSVATVIYKIFISNL